MPLHLIKLCVGVDTVRELVGYMRQRGRAAEKRGQPPRHAHVTRMTPTRGRDLVDGGSLYWVVRGQIAARQRLVEIAPFVDAEGVSRCRLWVDAQVVKVVPRPMRPFQGWRYLRDEDAPPDLTTAGADIALMPEAMRRELGQLGLL